VEKFFTDFKAAGGTSVLVADLSIDDADEIAPPPRRRPGNRLHGHPQHAPGRIEKIAQRTTGFIYTVSLLGTTGERAALSDTVKPLIARLKSLTDKPICVGFGISTPQHAKEIASAGADGVIIGSPSSSSSNKTL
jgi:tryptophan synthase alpha chain